MGCNQLVLERGKLPPSPSSRSRSLPSINIACQIMGTERGRRGVDCSTWFGCAFDFSVFGQRNHVRAGGEQPQAIPLRSSLLRTFFLPRHACMSPGLSENVMKEGGIPESGKASLDGLIGSLRSHDYTDKNISTCSIAWQK